MKNTFTQMYEQQRGYETHISPSGAEPDQAPGSKQKPNITIKTPMRNKAIIIIHNISSQGSNCELLNELNQSSNII